MAVRIRARAMRRCGEMLREIEPAKSGPKPQSGAHDGTQLGRFSSAEKAGLSRKQTVTALRVANVPREEFEAAIESKNPA